MNYNLPMPSLGADMDQAKLIEWKVKPGDFIKKNQIIASVETTKSVIDIESFKEGVFVESLVKIGDVISVGKPIAILNIEQDDPIDISPKRRVKISPAAKKMAEENNLDISSISSSGESGEILLQDVENKVNSLKNKTFEGRNLRLAISNLMSRSKKEIPHYYLKKRMNLDILMNWLDEKNIKLQTQDRLLLPSVLFKAIILSIKKFPELNGFYKNDNFKSIESINLGVAFSVEGGGVITPAILDAEKLNLMDLNLSLLNLSKRTKEGGLTNRELSEGTLTVTNLGGSGADEVFGIIFPPQVAIIGIGFIRKEPIVDEHDRLLMGFVADITLSADHRVSDGLLGARFLNEMARVLKNPNLLIENKE